ncbi:MAG: DUF481 domain-containing protein [Acidobacteriota bacterium]
MQKAFHTGLAGVALISLVLLPGLAAAQAGRAPQIATPPPVARPTVVTLANGDRATGLLAPSDASAIHLKTKGFGDLVLPWKGVMAVEFGDAIVVSVADGRQLSGRAAFNPDGTLVLKDATGESAVALTAIARLMWIDDPRRRANWRDHWNVSAASQLHASRGNSGETDFGGDLSITRQGEHSRFGLYANRRFSNASDGDSFSEVSDNANAGVRIDRNISKRLVGFVSTDFQHDRFQRLERLWVSGGMGWNVVTGETRNFTLPVGVSRGRDRQIEVIAGTGTGFDGRAVELSRSYNELQFGDSVRLQLKRQRGTISQDLTIYRQLGSASVSADAGLGNGVSNIRPIVGNVRAEFSAMLGLQFSSWLGWQVSVHDSYNRQPYQSVESNDFTISAGLTFAVGRKNTRPYGGTSSNVSKRASGDALPQR